MNFTFLALLFLAAPPQEPLQATPAQVDRGTVRTGPPLVQKFELRNTTNGAITLLGAKTGCNCLKPQLEKRILQPDDSTSLTVTVNTLVAATGRQSWKASVQYRAGNEERELQLTIAAELVAVVRAEPPSIAMSLTGDCNQTFHCDVIDIREKPCQWAGVKSSHPAIECRLIPVDEKRWRVEGNIRSGFPVGEREEALLVTSSDAEVPEIRIHVKVKKKSEGEVTVSPDVAEITVPRAGEGIARIVLRRAHGVVKVDRIESSSDEVKTQFTENRAMTVVRIQVRAGQEGSGTVKVILAEPREEVVIPVRWKSQVVGLPIK